jgi:hypothetical protein
MYRGATINADTTNTGIVSTTQGGNLRMNHLDYVLFNAATNFWTENYIYEWNALKREWSRLERPNNWEKYLEAVSDITTDAKEGVFSTAFIKTLFAQTLSANVANILFKLIVGGGANGIEIDGINGNITKKGFTSVNGSVKGFVLKGLEGLIETNNITTNEMNADKMIARSSFLSGALAVGDAFNENGDMVDATKPGIGISKAIIFPNRPGFPIVTLTTDALDLYNARCINSLRIGEFVRITPGKTKRVNVDFAISKINKNQSFSYYDLQRLTGNSLVSAQYSRIIKGSYTRQQLNTMIDENTESFRPDTNTAVAVSGSIYETGVSSVGFLIVTGITRNTSNTAWVISGQNTSGSIVNMDLSQNNSNSTTANILF